MERRWLLPPALETMHTMGNAQLPKLATPLHSFDRQGGHQRRHWYERRTGEKERHLRVELDNRGGNSAGAMVGTVVDHRVGTDSRVVLMAKYGFSLFKAATLSLTKLLFTNESMPWS